ncbi:Uncharacterised protein [Bordetella pertussis]|nr:Uncharacterised protein [Bordetella pertussis]CFW04704.1 Uncharacterised protein [Bordetella pertussis]CFW42464.1 Uncharacterised protein [Bordetella pertussis]
MPALLLDVAQLRARQVRQLQVLEEQVQELGARQAEGELIHRFALAGLRAGTIVAALRAIERIALGELAVAGVDDLAIAPLPVPETRLGDIARGKVDFPALVHVRDGPLADQVLYCLADLILVPP